MEYIIIFIFIKSKILSVSFSHCLDGLSVYLILILFLFSFFPFIMYFSKPLSSNFIFLSFFSLEFSSILCLPCICSSPHLSISRTHIDNDIIRIKRQYSLQCSMPASAKCNGIFGAREINKCRCRQVLLCACEGDMSAQNPKHIESILNTRPGVSLVMGIPTVKSSDASHNLSMLAFPVCKYLLSWPSGVTALIGGWEGKKPISHGNTKTKF